MDTQGNVYVLNVHAQNKSDLLWKYAPDGTILKCIELNRQTPNIEDPVGLLCHSSGRLYVASGQYDFVSNDGVKMYELSSANGDMTTSKTITIKGMHHPTGITESPDGVIYVVGITYDYMPTQFTPSAAGLFVHASMAEINVDGIGLQREVQAMLLSGDPGLALPMSIVWTDGM